MRIYSIYRITNKVNDKVYIGYTSREPRGRWMGHLRASNPNYKSHSKLHKSMHKHGIENFVFEVIYQTLDRNHALNTMESHFIREHNSYQNGYNMTLGGEGGNGLRTSKSEEHKRKIGLSNKGKNKGKPNWAKGKTGIYSEESLAKMRIAQSNRKREPRAGVGNVVITPIGTFATMRLAAKAYRKSPSWMSSMLKKQSETFYLSR